MSSIYVIDVMPLLYRGYFAFLKNPRRTSTGVNTSSLFSFTSTVLQILEKNSPTHMALVFDSTTPTFRHKAFPAYKAQRDKLPEDIAAAIPMAAEFAAAMRIPSIRVDGFEADDLLGTISAKAAGKGIEAFLVTPDKDIAQLVREGVSLYRLSGQAPEIMGPAEVCAHWGLSSPAQMIDYLALAGDASDNIPGVPGVGEKTAQKLLAEHGSLDAILAAAKDGKISGKLGEKLAGADEAAKMSRFLTEIRTDAPVRETLDDLRVREPDLDALAAFCAKYEFAAIAKRFGIGSSAPAAQANGAVGTAEAALARLADFPHTYTLVENDDALAALAAALKKAPLFAFDTETDSANPSEAVLVGISFATESGKAWYVPFAAAADAADAPGAATAEPDDLFAMMADPPPVKPVKMAGQGSAAPATTSDHDDLLAMMAPPSPPSGGARCGIARTAIVAALAPIFASGTEKVAHNSKFDREVLARHGMPVSMPCHDTMLMHFVLDAASRHGLDFLAKSILSYETIPISTLIGDGRDADPAKMAALPPSAILDYAAEDADVALRLYLALKPQTEAAGLSRALFESEEPLVDVLLDIERAGVKVDAVALHDFGRELAAQIAALQERIFAAAGGPFNLASPKQLGEVLFERLRIDEKARKTSSGQFATGEDVLQKYAPGNQIVKDILEWRAAEKLRSTYAEKLPACVSRIDGRIHTRLAQSFTETGRLSSSDPNLQNIPVRTEMGKRIRAAFVARDNAHVLISADYSQIELRIMAALSGDEAMIAAFRDGRDIHAETASRVFHVPPEEVTKLQRSQCKAINFGIIYGMSAFGLSQRLEIPRHEAAGFIEEYFRQYPGVKRYMEKAVENARAKGYAETILGRRRSLPDIASRNAATRQAAERNAVNTPVQGSAADLVKLAMVRVWRALRRENLEAEIILQIHDELLLDAPKDEEARVREILEREMSSAYDFGVPLVVETGSGATWLEAH